MTDLENKQAYFTNLNADNTQVFYTKNYKFWYLQNSKQANFNNKTLTGLKKDVRGITNSLGFRNDNIEVATVDVDGYKIKEDEFIEYEMGKVNELLLNSTITSQLKRKLKHYLEFLNTKIEASQLHHEPAPEVDPVNTKADVLHPKLKEYGFFEIEKVKELNPEKQSKLVKLIANNSLPYQMAMLDFLNFIEHLKKNHFTTQTKTDQELSKILGTDERAVKGNRLVLNEISKEDKNRYTSHQYTDKVQSDYNNL